jgi:hypothetical protein
LAVARVFNGSSDKARYSGAIASAAPLTFATWMYRPAATSSGHIIGIYASGSFGNSNFFVLRSGAASGGNISISASAATSSQASATITRSITDWPESTWQHTAAVFETTTSRYAYAGGVASSQETTSKSPTSLDRTTLGFQDNLASSSNWLNGTLAEAGIWSVALTAEEIGYLALGISPSLVRPESLLAYWPLWGIYSPEIDLFGGFNLTLTGTTTADQPATIQSPGGQRIFLPQTSTPFNPTGFPWLSNPDPSRSRFEVIAY